MEEKLININYKTISTEEQANLLKITSNMVNALTRNEFLTILMVYNGVIDRLREEGKAQGIDV